MKYLFYYILIYCFLPLSLAAQTHSLSGKVFFLNSGKSPAVGVEISGSIKLDSITIDANPVYTKDDGSYTLVFPKAAPGHVVEVKLGDKDSSGQSIEVVNGEELRICRIPEDPAEAFDIIICKKDERDAVAQRYYKIFKTSAERELDRMKKEWSALVDQSEKDYQKITAMSKRIDRFQKQADSLKLYKDAFRIASINKDGATKRVLKYLKLLDEGVSIQEARKELSIKNAINELEVGILQYNAAVEELETRATASKDLFDYKDAIRCYDTLIRYAEKRGIDRLKIAIYYTEMAYVIFDDGSYEKALKYLKKAMGIRKVVLNPKHLDLTNSYNNIGVTYNYLGSYSKALEYHQKAIVIIEAVLHPQHLKLATSYNNIGTTYQNLGQYSMALEYHQKAIAIQETVLGLKHSDLATSYGNIGIAYETLGHYEKALEYQQKAMTIRKAILQPQHPKLATSYNNIGTIYQGLGEYEKALEYHQKAITIREVILDSKHLDLAASYNNIGVIYQLLHQYDKALEYHQKAMGIREEILSPQHLELTTSYNNVGAIYQDFGKYSTALEYHHKSMSILEVVLEPKHPNLAICYNNIAHTYSALGLYDKALEYHQKATAILEAIDSKHTYLGMGYSNMAITYAAIKNFQKAIFYQGKCLAIIKDVFLEKHPYHKKALDGLAKIYALKGSDAYKNKDYLQAIEDYQKAIEIPNKMEELQNNIGLAYTKNKQFTEAKEAFSEYEKLFPKKGLTYRNWAMYYALQNNREKALENLQKAVELGYDDLKWLKEDDSMDSLRDETDFIELIEKLEQSLKK